MNKQFLIGGIIGAVAVTAVGAVATYQVLDSSKYAEVVSVTPTSKTVSVPREECSEQLVTVPTPVKDEKQIAGTVAGAVIGGVLGNQVGGGSGRKIATVAGAAAGGYAGNKVQENIQKKNTHQEYRTVCNTVYDTHEESTGFDVAYLVDGQERTVHMDKDPGGRIAMENGKPVLEQ